jgi:hypothetical protein
MQRRKAITRILSMRDLLVGTEHKIGGATLTPAP